MTRSQATPASSQMIWMEQRIAELEKQLAANNPLLDEAADKIDALQKDADRYRWLRMHTDWFDWDIVVQPHLPTRAGMLARQSSTLSSMRNTQT